MNDLTGRRFTRLEVMGFTNIRQSENGLKRAYWTCVCDCGAVKTVASNDLVKGSTRSCGCYNRDAVRLRQRRRFGEASFSALIAAYRTSAAKRGYDFFLTEDEFREFTNASCFYCGKGPMGKKVAKSYYGHYPYNGIDRVDNSKGYTMKNCVSCCKYCNAMKMAMNLEDFLSHVFSIVAHQQGQLQSEKYEVPFDGEAQTR